jgi:hypothetical protein
MVNGFTLQAGRKLNSLDVPSGCNVCILGSNVASKLFGDHIKTALDHIIKVGGNPYRVIGVLKSKGSSGLLRQVDIVVTSYNSARRSANASPSFFIGEKVDNVAMLDPAIGEETAQFRGIRKILPTDADNFSIEKSDKFAELFITFLTSITAAAAAIGMITLIGAAIGLMNIMLVSVNERTREVGLIKAIGGKSKNVRQQFLFESMIISLLGALFGIILGVLVGNIFSIFLKTGFVVPWIWVSINVFSTCGYSAFYGQALASVLLLGSVDLPEKSEVSASITSVFLGSGTQQLTKNKKASYGFNYSYTNLTPYFALLSQNPDYFMVPQLQTADANFRVKTKSVGMIKYYSTFCTNQLGIRNADIDSLNLKDAFQLKNINWYNNITWRENLGKGWNLNAGFSFAINNDKIHQQLQDANNRSVVIGMPILDAKSFQLNNQQSYTQCRAVF